MTPSPAWDRALILAFLERASGAALHASDSLPDSLIAEGQALGLTQLDVTIWIFREPCDGGWTPEALAAWAHRVGLAGVAL